MSAKCQLHTIVARPKLGANGRAPTARCLLRLQRARPKRTAWLEGCAALVSLFQRQHVATRPKASFEGGRMLFRQARIADSCSSCRELVVERTMLNHDTIRVDSQEAKPDSRRSVVRGHPDSAGVMP